MIQFESYLDFEKEIKNGLFLSSLICHHFTFLLVFEPPFLYLLNFFLGQKITIKNLQINGV